MLSKQFDKMIALLHPESLEVTLLTLREIYDDIAQHPNDDKYCQIKLAREKLNEVWVNAVCKDFMTMSGWVVEDDHMKLKDDSNVHTVRHLLESLCEETHVNLDPAQVFSETMYSVYELISAMLQGNIFDIYNFLKTFTISTSGMVYFKDGSSINLMLTAILSQNINVVKLLVKKYSIDPWMADNGVVYVYQVFTIAPESFIINFLKVCCTKMSFRNQKAGITLLHHAVCTCCFQVVCYLVEECKIDLNINDNDLDTPLHMAYITGHTHIAHYLIQRGADIIAVNSRGCKPYDYIGGIPEAVQSSLVIKNCRKIHEIPGSAEYNYYIKLCNINVNFEEAVAQTILEFPALKEDGLVQSHHDIDYISFSKELTHYTLLAQ